MFIFLGFAVWVIFAVFQWGTGTMDLLTTAPFMANGYYGQR